MKIIRLLALSCCTLLLSACANTQFPLVYKQDIPQGNIITQDMVKQLKVGMTKDQVAFLLGNPVLADSFHTNRWDYFYSFKPGYGTERQYHLICQFDKDLLKKITQQGKPLQDKTLQ